MSDEEFSALASAYVAGAISRRRFVRRLVASGATALAANALVGALGSPAHSAAPPDSGTYGTYGDDVGEDPGEDVGGSDPDDTDIGGDGPTGTDPPDEVGVDDTGDVAGVDDDGDDGDAGGDDVAPGVPMLPATR